MMTTAMCPLRVLLLWALLCPGRGNVQEEIFTRPGSDLLIPIRIHLTLNHTDTRRCDGIEWRYKPPTRDESSRIFQHRGCTLRKPENTTLPNIRLSENGSLIISNVTPENDGMYIVEIHNSTGHRIQTDYYTVHVEGNVQEEIFTRPGSDLLIPIRIHPTLNHTDRGKCDQIEWKYKPPTRNESRIFLHRGCTLRKSENTILPNIKISENGSLIISNVTPENDGMYIVEIHNSAGHHIQRDYYTVHVEVPVSGPDLKVSCLQNGSAKISCRVEEGSKPNIRLSVIGGSQRNYSVSANNITAIVEPSGPWNITCTVMNRLNQSEISQAGVTCPVPLSDITMNHTCFPNGSAEAECSVKGSDPRYSWSLDGRSVSSHRRVTLPPPVSGTLHCDVTNQINNLSRSINISCPVPVSDPVLHVKCLQNGSAEISCSVEKGTNVSVNLTVSGGLEVYNATGSERTVRVTVPLVSSPHSWNITCSAQNAISLRTANKTSDTCPEIRSCWGHFLSSGAVFVLYTGLLIFMVNDLRKMKNEKNEKSRSERRTRRRDPMEVEMEMEPSYYNEGT
ncbi:hemicentin-1-like [Lithobates pipiens]